MTVAVLTPADTAPYKALMLHAYEHAADAFTSTPEERARESDQWWVKRIAHPEGLTVAFGYFEEKRLVGTVALEFSAKPKTRHKALVVGMYVLPSSRGKGAARALLQAAIQCCLLRAPIQALHLEVTEGNTPALKLYESLGFKAYGVEPMAVLTPSGFKSKVQMWLGLAAQGQRTGALIEPVTNPLGLDIPVAIETDRLLLRPPRAGDGAALYEAVAESLTELRKFIGSVPWVAAEQSVEASEVYCRTAASNFVARRDQPYLLWDRQTQQLVGSAGLHRTDWATPKTEVGYWCRTSRCGAGLITEAVTALTQLAFQTLAAARVELITDEQNRASRRVAERCGFALEGVLRNERRAPDGMLRHTCVYARLPATAE